ncbi:MAG TPA: methyltransferase domain-containing protein [Gammaproteobacteria bacterium]|nr:methyltransferase domain-containing protein [Gammaproteobacteria bacterium]
MTCCCPHSISGGRLFSFFARSYRRRFAKKGFEPSQRQLLAGLSQAGFQDASLLEIGSGVGYLHQTLLAQGARTAVGIDLSADMLKEAEDWAAERGLAGRTQYLQGDFIELLDEVVPAEITILDKVVCCYPFADLLLNSATKKTRRVIALTYPRQRWFIRGVVELMAVVLRLAGSDFRAYVHDPRDIERWITKAGFKKTFQQQTFIWLSQVYEKP